MSITRSKNRNNRNYKTLLSIVTFSTATVLLLLSSRVSAIEFVLTPILQTDLVFTDNVQLRRASDPDKKSDFITRIIPGFEANASGRRFNAEVNYRLANTIHARLTDRNRSFHKLDAIGNAELLENLLFLDTNVRINQQNRSIITAQGDDINDLNNRRTVRSYTVSPYLRKDIGKIAIGEVRYKRNWTDSDSSTTFFNSQSNTYMGSLISGPSIRRIAWGLHYSRQKIEYDLRPDSVKLENALADVRFNILRTFALTATGGYESNNFSSTAKPKGVRWTGGFIWTPSKRTDFEASAGQRFFGDTYNVKFNHRTRLSAWSATYDESVTSSRSFLDFETGGSSEALLTSLFTAQAPPGTDPAEIAQVVDLFINSIGIPNQLSSANRFLTNRFFIRKILQASVGFNTAKNTLILNGYNSRSTPIDNNPLLDTILIGNIQLANVKRTGGSALYSRTMGGKTRANLQFTYVDLIFPGLGNRKDTVKSYSFSVTKQISKKLMALLEFRRRERSSNAPGSRNSFAENRATASIIMRF